MGFDWRRGRRTEYELQRVNGGGWRFMEGAIKALPYLSIGAVVALIGNAAGISLSSDHEGALQAAHTVEDVAYGAIVTTLLLFIGGAVTAAFTNWLYHKATPKNRDFKH